MSKLPHSNTLAGWREWVQLPDVGIPWIKAKLDTGARTSSIHAYATSVFERDGVDWVRFRVRPWQESVEYEVVIECPVARSAPGSQLVGARAGAVRRALRHLLQNHWL